MPSISNGLTVAASERPLSQMAPELRSVPKSMPIAQSTTSVPFGAGIAGSSGNG